MNEANFLTKLTRNELSNSFIINYLIEFCNNIYINSSEKINDRREIVQKQLYEIKENQDVWG